MFSVINFLLNLHNMLVLHRCTYRHINVYVLKYSLTTSNTNLYDNTCSQNSSALTMSPSVV